jgi:hypothetical protein
MAQDLGREDVKPEQKTLLEQAVVPALVTALFGVMMYTYQQETSGLHARLNALEQRLLDHDRDQAALLMSQHNTDVGQINLQLQHMELFNDQVRQRWTAKARHEEECEKERRALIERVLHLEHAIGAQ